jgi:RHS repeat-associated protein
MVMAGISSKAAGKLENKNEKFQGQPIDDDLGLNWYGFKWRNHDPQIGRIIQTDPLSEEYVYNSTYAFSENKVTSHVELEGLEALPTTGARGIDGKYPVQGDVNGDYKVDESEVSAWLGAIGAQLEIGLQIALTIQGIGVSVRSLFGSFIKSKTSASNDTKNEKGSTNQESTKRSTNKLEPDTENTTEDHSTFKRDENGDIYKYQEWKRNDKNPKTGFEGGKRFDGGRKNGKPGTPHHNKKTGEDVPTPHINDPKYPGGVRKAGSNEKPDNNRFNSN